MYCSIEELRHEGVTETMASDERLEALSDEASALIDRLTGWFFEPRHLELVLDGRGTPTLELPVPLLRLEQMLINNAEVFDEDQFVIVGAPVGPGFDGPRITFRHGLIFPRGVGNVVVGGMFGFTEPDGSELGHTPLAIRRACLLLVLRWLHPAASDASHDARHRWRIVEEKTRDQSYKLGALPSSAGSLTGDPEVDELLALYRRPARMGAA